MNWSALRQAVTEAGSSFDPSRTTVADAEAVLRHCTAMLHVLGAVQARAAVRVAGSDRWRLAGARNPAEHLARTTGTSVGAARRTLTTGECLDREPLLLEAAVGGVLSATQTGLIAESLTSPGGEDVPAPEQAQRLVEVAGLGSLATLREECARVRASTDPDPDATRARVHAGRRLRIRHEPDGGSSVELYGSRLDGAWLTSVLEPMRDEIFSAARRAGQRIAADAAGYDAMFALLRGAVDGSGTPPGRAASDGARRPRQWSRAKVIVRVDSAAAERGRAERGELCEIADAGPVAVADVRAMLAQGASLAVVRTERERVVAVAHLGGPEAARTDVTDPRSLAAALAGSGRPVAELSHSGRSPTAHQLTALEWTSPTCTALGCAESRCDVDHRTGWALTRTTRTDDLDPLCRHHHNLKTRQSWALVRGHGPRAMVGPGDPRHPGHARHSRAG